MGAVVNNRTGQTTTVTVPNNPANMLFSLGATIIPVTGNLLITEAHNGCILQVNAATDITLTLAATTPPGVTVMVDQIGSGKAIFAAESGGTKANRSSFDRTAGANAVMTAYVRSNVNAVSAAWLLNGDGATA